MIHDAYTLQQLYKGMQQQTHRIKRKTVQIPNQGKKRPMQGTASCQST